MSFGERGPVARWRVSTAWKRLVPRIKARDGHRCAVCGAPETIHRSRTGKRMSNLVIGHRTPPERYSGSPYDSANLFALCRACNASQGNRTEAEWQAAGTGRLVGLRAADYPAPTGVLCVECHGRFADRDELAAHTMPNRPTPDALIAAGRSRWTAGTTFYRTGQEPVYHLAPDIRRTP